MKNKIVVISLSACSNPSRPVYTAYEDFLRTNPETFVQGDAAIRYLKDEGFEIVPVLSARARGKMTAETFFHFCRDILDAIPTDDTVAGCLLYMASGMVADVVGNGDLYLIPQIRERIGYDVPIAIPMDFHGNMPYAVLKSCNIITTFRTNPHVDVQATQMKAAKLLARAIHQEKSPHNIGVSIPFSTADSCTYAAGAGAAVNDILDSLEQLSGVWSASLITSMYWSNSTSTRSLLTVSCDDEAANTLSSKLLDASQKIWALRGDFESIHPLATPEEAYQRGMQAPKGPFFVDDTGDNPTCSGVGDSAYMLKLAQKMQVPGLLIAGIWDAPFVDACAEVGEGARLSRSIGASVDSTSISCMVQGMVKHIRRDADGNVTGASFITDGGITLLATKYSNMSPLDMPLNRTFIESFGEDCMSYKIIVLKLGYLLDDFVSIMSGCAMAMSPGIVELNIDALCKRLTHVRRPLYPLDDVQEFTPRLA